MAYIEIRLRWPEPKVAEIFRRGKKKSSWLKIWPSVFFIFISLITLDYNQNLNNNSHWEHDKRSVGCKARQTELGSPTHSPSTTSWLGMPSTLFHPVCTKLAGCGLHRLSPSYHVYTSPLPLRTVLSPPPECMVGMYSHPSAGWGNWSRSGAWLTWDNHSVSAPGEGMGTGSKLRAAPGTCLTGVRRTFSCVVTELWGLLPRAGSDLSSRVFDRIESACREA